MRPHRPVPTRTGRHRRRREGGATAVEFALVAPVVFALIGGLLAFGLRVTFGAVAEFSARVALRDALLPTGPGTYPDEAAIRSKAAAAVPNLLGNPANVVVCPPSCTQLTGDACPSALDTPVQPVDLPRLRLAAAIPSPTLPTATPPTVPPTTVPPVAPTVAVTATVVATPTVVGPTSVLPTITATVAATITAIPSVTLTPEVTLSVGPPTLPPSPAASPTPAQPYCIPDNREGKLVVVQVTWDVPAISGALKLAPFLPADLATVTRTVTGRRE